MLLVCLVSSLVVAGMAEEAGSPMGAAGAWANEILANKARADATRSDFFMIDTLQKLACSGLS
jgi:hypothetical protein